MIDSAAGAGIPDGVLWLSGAPVPEAWGSPARFRAAVLTGSQLRLVVGQPLDVARVAALPVSDVAHMIAGTRSDVAFQMNACDAGVEPDFVRAAMENESAGGTALDAAVGRLAFAGSAAGIATVWPLDRHDVFATVLAGQWLAGVVPRGSALVFTSVRPSWVDRPPRLRDRGA